MQNIEVILEALGQAIFERDCRIHTLEYELKRIKENLKDKESLIDKLRLEITEAKNDTLEKAD